MGVFHWGGKPVRRVLGANSSAEEENQQQTLPTNNKAEIEPGPHKVCDRGMLSLLRHLCSVFWSCDLGVLLTHKSYAACNVLNHSHTLALLSLILLCFFAFGVGYGHSSPSDTRFMHSKCFGFG